MSIGSAGPLSLGNGLGLIVVVQIAILTFLDLVAQIQVGSLAILIQDGTAGSNLEPSASGANQIRNMVAGSSAVSLVFLGHIGVLLGDAIGHGIIELIAVVISEGHGAQAQSHNQAQNQSNNFLHVLFPP